MKTPLMCKVRFKTKKIHGPLQAVSIVYHFFAKRFFWDTTTTTTTGRTDARFFADATARKLCSADQQNLQAQTAEAWIFIYINNY